MQINITGKNFDISEQLNNYTHKKLQKLNTYQEYISKIQISFHKEHLSHIAEGQITVIGKPIFAKTESPNMNESIDILIDRLIRQLKTYRDKITDHR